MEVLTGLGRASEASTIEQDIILRAHTDPSILTQIARFYEDAGRLSDAEDLTRRVRATGPGPRVLAAAANLLARFGKHDEAEVVFREALERRPGDASLLNSLGYMNADRNVRVSEALALIDKALLQTPGDADFLDSRGWALFRLGRLEEAESVLRLSLAERESGETHDHLGDVLAARGKAEDAAAAWRSALEFGDLSEERRVAIERKLMPASTR